MTQMAWLQSTKPREYNINCYLGELSKKKVNFCTNIVSTMNQILPQNRSTNITLTSVCAFILIFSFHYYFYLKYSQIHQIVGHVLLKITHVMQYISQTTLLAT